MPSKYRRQSNQRRIQDFLKGGGCKQGAEKYKMTKNICMDHRNKIEAPDPVVKDLISSKITKQ